MRHTFLPLAVAASLLGLAHGDPASATAAPSVPLQMLAAPNVGMALRQRPSGVSAFVALPLRNQTELENLVRQQSTPGGPLYHRFLTGAQFRAAYGASPQALAAAQSTLQAQGFKTERTSSGVFVSAPQATFERAFGIRLGVAHGTMQLVADRPLTLPQALSAAGAHIVAFSKSRGLKPQSVRLAGKVNPNNRYSEVGPYWATDLKQAYKYPAYQVASGRGRTIGIVGFQDFLDSDMTAYFTHEHLNPTIVRRLVAGGPAPADPLNSGLTQELQLDIVMSGGGAPNSTVVTYLGPTPPTPNVPDETFITPFVAAVEDNAVDILSTSFGGCETDNFPYIAQIFHNLFLQGNAQGITFIFSSGDSAAFSCKNGLGLGVSAFADDPNVTAVGGTVRLVTTYPETKAAPFTSKYVDETSFAQTFNPAISGSPAGALWGSGGGISTFWSKPAYQNLVETHSKQRTVPDLSMQMGGFACKNPQFPIILPTPGCRDGSSAIVPLDIGLDPNGGYYGFVGTSVSAPEFAGLLALQEETLGGVREGNANYLIYALAATPSLGVFQRGIPGNNGYVAYPGYNYVLGNGTIRGAAFVGRGAGPFAGDPYTPTNP